MVFIILEIISFSAMAILARLWISDPSGNYEPWTVLLGAVGALFEIRRRRQSRPGIKTDLKPNQKEEIIDWIQKYGIEKPLSQVLPRALQLAQIIGDRDLEH